MKEFFDSYANLKLYPEFDLDLIEEKYNYWIDGNTEDGDGEWKTPNWIFKPSLAFEYVMLAYAPDSSLAKIKDQKARKEKALTQSDVPKDHWDKILKNENPMVGDMITRLFRHLNDLDYELLISGKEAIETLLEVVRKPINTSLQDDKERNAVKAKRECFEDAQALLKEIRKIYNQMNDIDSDMADHINTSVFKGGIAERLAEKAKKK
jgi:hypothetical protein